MQKKRHSQAPEHVFSRLFRLSFLFACLTFFFSNSSSAQSTLVASSNNSGMVGVFSVMPDGSVMDDAFASMATDADGIYYDEVNDVLYQLNRDLNVVNAYSNVSTSPMLTATSTSDFTNGREIAVTGNKLVVADDVDGANKLVVYDISPTTITLSSTHDVDINLWGIHANGNQLFAVVDNSSDIAVFENFFNQPIGPLAPTATVTIENLVRTHGITYIADRDMMYLTDVGDAASATDGAIIRIKKWSDASADGTVDMSEQIRNSGGASLLGNPVDIAYDEASDRVFVAERARDGGYILGFKNPVLSGGIAPAYTFAFPGASAVSLAGSAVDLDECDFVFGGTVALTGGNTETTIIVDGNPDLLTFESSVNPIVAGHDFTYVITDADGIILGIPPANANDFDPAGVGACNVYGLSYTGNLSIAPGDDLLAGLPLSDDCFDLSSNAITVNRIAPIMVDGQFFVSSNTSGNVGVYTVFDDGSIVESTFASMAADADGIFYDEANDVLYQLNRTDDVVNAYSNVSTAPVLTATSSSDFTNGREIAVSGNKLIVADDVTDANQLVVYDISPTAITLDKVHSVDINLWGIHANGNQLFAIVDNSSDVAVFENFFNQPAGALTADMTVTIENMVRTHGITYVASKDMMFLTDVGDAGSAVDGAFYRIKNWSNASADGMVSASEAIRVSGGQSGLGNPVDIAFDDDNGMVYVAERANGGGRVLGFNNPVASGGIAPVFNSFFVGASGIHFPGTEVAYDPCDFVMGGTVALPNGDTEVTTIVDGNPDVISFTSSVDAMAAGHDFTYVITDDMGMVLGVPPGDSQDFDPAGTGACNVYGLSYTGNLTVMAGDDLFGGQDLSDDCWDLSSNSIVVNRIAPTATDASFYVSSNTSGKVGVYNILADGNITMTDFDVNAMDADGIFYDTANDVLYQLNRTDDVVNIYSDVSTTPTLVATSSSDFTNGREIAVTGNKLVVADDVTDANQLVVYDITTSTITLDKVYTVDFNTWGIHANGGQLFAIMDNSSDVAVFDNFFSNAAGAITPTATVTIENMVRTHGITYVADKDMMFLTDVGDAGSAVDGAFFRIKKWSDASADGTVSASEAIRVSGGQSGLGNPVDIAFDDAKGMVYVAERANGGGRVLGFRNPAATGGIAPIYNSLFAGASAIHLPGTEVAFDPCDSAVNGGSITFSDGNTETTTVNDGVADVLSFTSSDAVGDNFTYVITDDMGMVLGVPPGNSNDFDPAGVGACNVYGLSYNGTLTVMAGDDLFGGQDLADDCWDLSNAITVNRIDPQNVEAQLFVSSNTQSAIGTYDIFEDGTLIPGNFAGVAMDADGIYYDDVNDILYQLNRTDHVINVYETVSTTPTLIATSSSDFTNGREITVAGPRLVVADDVDGANRLVVYDITNPSMITLDKVFDVSINLWGIHADGNRLMAIVDNSSDVAIFDNFFAQPAGTLNADVTVTIENMVRTHGLDYDAADDMLILTDVGSGGDANDGALVVIRQFAAVSADGMVSASEQARAFGAGDFLGNPVDVALDKQNKRIYVAERANGGGRLLGFLLPQASGGIAPFYNQLYAGCSAVMIPEGPCDFLTGGFVSFDDGTFFKEITAGDGNADVLSFLSTVDAAANGYSQTFVVTDADDIVLGIPMGNSQDFEGAGIGACRIYNVSYTGTLTLMVGDDIKTAPLSDDCAVLSNNLIVVNRVGPFTGDYTTGRDTEAVSSTVANLYPVPVTNELNVVIESTLEQEGIINIYNAAGSIVIRQNVDLTVGKNTLTFNVTNLESGMYFVQLPASNTVTKFVKANK